MGCSRAGVEYGLTGPALVEKYRRPEESADPMSTWNQYILAHSYQDVFQALSAAAGPARLVAGGTDLLLEIQQGHHAPVDTLVDVTNIPELNVLEIRGSELFIGAAVPVAQVTESPLVMEHARADKQLAASDF